MTEGVPATTTTAVVVGGHPEQLVKIPSPETPVNNLDLVIDLGDTIAFANTGASYPLLPNTPNANPLIADPNRLIEMTSHLRPYPQ